MSETDPIGTRPKVPVLPRAANANGLDNAPQPQVGQRPAELVRFDRRELMDILNVYGRQVARGEWRDYAIDMGRERAVFAIYRRSNECALYRIEKNPRLARKQGLYCVITATGLILKRGPDLRRVLAAIDKTLAVV